MGRVQKSPNTVRWVGDKPGGDYVMIPNELARSTLSADAKAVALWLRSHKSGYDTSQRAVAVALGKWGNARIGKAFRDLIDDRWLVIREHRNERGGLMFADYLMHQSRRFTQAEAADLALPASRTGGCARSTHPDEFRVCQDDTPSGEGVPDRHTEGVPDRQRGGVPDRHTKEDQPRKLTKNPEAHVGRGVRGEGASADAATPMPKDWTPSLTLCETLSSSCGFGEDDRDEFVGVVLRERFKHDPRRIHLSADWESEFARWVRSFSETLDARGFG